MREREISEALTVIFRWPKKAAKVPPRAEAVPPSPKQVRPG